LSKDAIDQILHVIATFDRERGIPHDYSDLETVLRRTSFVPTETGELAIGAETVAQVTPARIDGTLDDAIEGKEMLLRAAREWLE
jgi:hypothetical protein